LDTLMHAMAVRSAPARSPGAPVNVLVAPSWGECSLVEHGLEPLIEILLQAHFQVTLRLHPMTRRHAPGLARQLLRTHEGSGRFRFDPHINTTDSLLDADIMISEWSGAPLEYAFARERPVIFIDTPAKVNNPNFGRIDLPCLEVDIREQIGRIVKPDALHELPRVVRELVDGAQAWAAQIRSVREATVFNVGDSGRKGAEIICETLGYGTAAKPAKAANG
jgi:YidC/Oxa1 family membrane protein insertase